MNLKLNRNPGVALPSHRRRRWRRPERWVSRSTPRRPFERGARGPLRSGARHRARGSIGPWPNQVGHASGSRRRHPPPVLASLFSCGREGQPCRFGAFIGWGTVNQLFHLRLILLGGGKVDPHHDLLGPPLPHATFSHEHFLPSLEIATFN